jgi:hypothetical protein
LIVRKLAVLKKSIIIFLTFCFSYCLAQKDTLPYNRKKEIVFDGKRYRVYNSYLTFGAGKAYSDIRTDLQSVLNVDFQFHLQKEYFQAGFFMSGDQFLRNTNVQGHLCYGYRYEKNLFNLAGFVGPSYSYFVTGSTDTSGIFKVTSNTALGGYICLQAVYKVKYDVGLGIELFADITALQRMAGARIICYFSGAYRGEKRGYKPKKN